MSNMSYEEPRMEMPEPHPIPDEKQYRDDRYRGRDDTEDFDFAMDEHAPVIQDTLQNRDSLIRGIINGTIQPSGSTRKRSSRKGGSHSTSASMSSANTPTPRAPASQSSATSSHNGHARHASTSAINGTTNGTPTADEISKLISRLATERQKTANLQDSLTRAYADAQFHAKRLEDAESRMNEQRKREAENTKRRKAMEIEVSKMREQLRFVKVQYDGAVAEIRKAQDVINSLEEERGRAVQEANREREKVRVLEEERKLKEAREAGYEEGRRLGMEEGVKRGAAEGKRYGVKDGREVERERQKKAMRELVEDDEVYEPRLPREQQQQQQQQQRQEYSEPREIYHRVGDETPGLSRSRSLNVNPIIAPVVTVDPQTHTANVLGLPLLETGNPSAAGYPSTAPPNLSRHPSAPVGNREQTHRGHGAPNYGAVFPRDNPNVNILSGFEDEPARAMGMAAPELSMEAALGKRDNRTSAPPRINTSSIDRDRDRPDPSQQRSWGGGIIGNGQGYRAPIRQRSGSGGTNGTTGTGVSGLPRNTGRGSVTPPSASTQDRSTPLDQYGILGDGGGYGGGLMSQVAEMTPIMEAGSEPGPTPTQAYFQDAAMGVRPPQEEIDRRERERRAREQREAEERARYEQDRFKQQQQQNQRWEPPPQPPQEHRYVPPQRRTPQPSPTNPTGPGGPNDWRRKSPQPSSASNSSTLVNGSVRGPQRKPVPGLGNAAANGRPRGNSINAPRGHGRAGSADVYGGAAAPAPATRPGTGAAGGHSLPPIEIFPGTPPDQENARSTKMAQAGSTLMSSPAFVTRDIGYGADPGAASSRGAGGSQVNGGGGHSHGHGHGGGGHGHGGRAGYGPHGTPLASPQPMRSPLVTGGELRNEYVENDPTGGPYRPNSRQQQHGNARQGQGPASGAHRRGAVSLGGVGDHGRHQQPPPSPSRFTTELHHPPHQHQPPPPSSSSRFLSTNLAQPTPRHAANALDMSPEEITIHPSGTTPVSTGRFDAGGQYAGATTNTAAAKGKGKAKPSAQVKRMRRQGYVDYDDEVPEDLTMGSSVRDQDPPMTTRSRVQSMYGISDHNAPKRTPQYESAPLPKKTPVYEDAPLPLPKSARMMPGGLPQHQSQSGGYTFGQEGRGVFGHGQPMPSPAKSQTSSQARRVMEDDLDTPIGPYDEQHHDHDQNRFSTIDILDEKAELWEPKSGTFHERKLPSYAHDDVEIVPPPNASPQNRPVRHQDTSFLGTVNHPPPPASPSVGVRGPPNAYVDTRHFDDSSMGPIHSSNQPNSFVVDRSGNPIRTPLRQSMPITASARSSTSAMPLPPVQPKDIPWATGKTATSQLPRPDTMYESAPPSATTVPPTSTTWGYVRESGQSLAPLGPLSNGGLAFSVGGGMANQSAMYNLANTSPVSTGRAQPMPLPTFYQNQIPPPGSTRSNIMQIPGTARSGVMGLPPPGSTRFNIMDVAPPGTGRSAVHPLPSQSQSQIMLAGMLSSQGPGPEMDEDPIIPSGGGPAGGGKKKKAGKKKK